MYLLGFSLDNLSLMALTIATGFVVDDAIVVLENISRHVEDGMPRHEAALRGAKEVGFTVISISVSLVAVFIPILLMGGIVGRLFREFTATLSLAIAISMVISLTTTPMMCAWILRCRSTGRRSRRSFLDRSLGWYERTLAWSLRHGRLVMLALLVTIALNVLLFTLIPKGFFPQEDTGLITGGIVADQSISFQLMKDKLVHLMDIVQADPAVESVAGYTGAGSGGGGSQTNTGSMYVLLKPLAVRKISSDEVIARLRPQLAQIRGGRLFLQTVQDIRVGARQANAQYQFTLQADQVSDLNEWGPKLLAALQASPVVADVNSDQQQKGLETDVTYDRATAARLGLTVSELDSTLYDAFGQRQVSTIYNALNQYHVVMEVAPRYWQSPQSLDDIYVSTSGGAATGTQTSNLLTAGGGATSTTAIGGSGSAAASLRLSAGATSIARSTRSGAGSSATSMAGLAGTDGAGSAATSTSTAGASNSVTKRVDECHREHRPRRGVERRGGQRAPGDHGAPAAVSRRSAGTTRLAVNHHGLFASTTLSFQPAARHVLERCHAGGEPSHARHPHADLHSRHVRRHRRHLPAIALERAAAHRGRAARGLHRARRALRELRASDHHHLDLAVRGRRRRARAHALAHRVQHHRPDRRDPAHRHREEERHHDDRLRHSRRAHAGARRRARPSTRPACCAFVRS